MPVEQVRSQQRHERILDAALHVFSTKGFHQTAVDDIAEESETSKGGLYFHFPTKHAIFLALLDRMAGMLRSRVQAAVQGEPDPIARADVALQVVLQTFASHRTLSRLFFVEALGAGPEFSRRMLEIRASFAALIQEHLDEAVRQAAIPPLDTAAASRVWFGALNEVVTSWVLAETPARLEDSYPTVRALLLRSIGAQVPSPGAAAPRAAPAPAASAVGTAPVATPSLATRLAATLAEAHSRAAAARRPVLASVVVPTTSVEPVRFFHAGEARSEERAFWSRPRTGFALAAVGSAASLVASGQDRFARVAADWQSLVEQAVVDAPADTIGVGPILLGGFAFDPLTPRSERWEAFPDASLLLPRLLLTHVDGRAWLTVTTLVQMDTDQRAEAEALQREAAEVLARAAVVEPSASHLRPPSARAERSAESWQGLVSAVADEIRRGDLEKAVLARAVVARGDAPFDVPAALDRLQEDYPSCFVFALAHGGDVFLGASPERLARLRDGIVTTMCLAGSIRRGATDVEDQQLGEALLGSAKDRGEHEVVVRALTAALTDVCETVAPTSTPVLLKVRNVQHLLTTVVGRVQRERTVLDVVERLHPTPAVGGFPRHAALALIREREGLDRGWYAGPVGWLDARGDGELAVAIRSGLVQGSAATLIAGCGIVADSDPSAEYAEAELKLRPMLTALGAAPS